MIKYFKIAVILFVVAALGIMGFYIYQTAEAKKQAQEKISTLPDFTFYTLDGEPFTRSSLKKDMPVSIILFSTGCDHCHYEAKELKENIGRLKGIQFLLISEESPEEVQKFKEYYELDKPELIFLRDPGEERLKKLGTASVPTVFVYNKAHQLVKHYVGETKIEAIVKAANS